MTLREARGRSVGEALAQKYDPEKLAILDEAGRLADFLNTQGDGGRPGGGWGYCASMLGRKWSPIITYGPISRVVLASRWWRS